jgi:hypothetical protein
LSAKWVEASLICQILKDCGIGSLQHLAKNLDRRGNDFRAMGKSTGRKYKLTEPDRREAFQSMRQLVIS